MEHKRLSSFVRLGDDESFDREYYIAHTNRRRFRLPVIVGLLVLAFLTMIMAASAASQDELPSALGVLFVGATIGALVVLYFALRRLKISHGYAALTGKRLLYYEYNEHPAENYQSVRSVHLEDVTGISFRIDRSLFQKSFYMVTWTSRKALTVGAVGWLGMLNFFGSESTLEPGPDAVQFIQDMTGAIAARKAQLQTGGSR